MNKHYTKYLINKYVPLYQKRNDMTTHPFDFHFHVHDGWFNLINTLSAGLCEQWLRASNVYFKIIGKQGKRYMDVIHGTDHHVNDPRFNFLITDSIIEMRRELYEDSIRNVPIAISVAEKYGGLHFYAHNSNTEQSVLIQFANTMSFSICEICGAPGKLSNAGGLLASRCSAHREIIPNTIVEDVHLVKA